MPANLGYMSAMLFNQNNCAAEASTVTTKFEVEVGNDLCVMMGYDRDRAMGHLTAGGTVANIEAIWAERNVKYFPLGLQEALLKEERLAAARGYKVSRVTEKSLGCRPKNFHVAFSKVFGPKHLLQRLVRNLLDAVKLSSTFEVTEPFLFLIRFSSPKKEKKRK